ncbi:hypothetical protein ANTPLA_LOCUS9355 [Anthophora plagiata]
MPWGPAEIIQAEHGVRSGREVGKRGPASSTSGPRTHGELSELRPHFTKLQFPALGSSIVPRIPPGPRHRRRPRNEIQAKHAPRGNFGHPERVVRRLRAIRTLEPPRSSLDSSLQICSRIVLLQTTVPEFCRSQACRRVSVEMHNYIELRYKLC